MAGVAAPAAPGEVRREAAEHEGREGRTSVQYPRVFTGRNLAMLAFPLGGVGAGAIALGGRGQLRDWEIFNKPEKGKSPNFAFPAIRAQVGAGAPITRVLERRILPPYEGDDGLGSQNAPGLTRLAEAVFTGEYPLASIEFRDANLPVRVSLEAFSPFVPLEADDSGLPVAFLRYRVKNPSAERAKVSIAFSIDNPVDAEQGAAPAAATRKNEYRKASALEGLFMHNPGLAKNAPRAGSFVLAAMNIGTGRLTHLTGWPRGRWWTSPLLFWDDFAADGSLGPETGERNAVGSVCIEREIAPRGEAEYVFLLAWHFPNRTPARMGWAAPEGAEETIIGNHYALRFVDAWKAAEYAAGRLTTLEAGMRTFLAAVRETTLPDAVKEAAMANLSTLASSTCFRTADGRFWGWEGSGCCFGNCDHVWNYETATHYLFPALARSMRETHLELADKMNGAMPIRVQLPIGKQTSGPAAADGQMGQVIKAYFDWQLSGDAEWLKKWWPSIKKSLEFAWVRGGWDGDGDGVFEGVQHNTYDVEFYGPNPLCGIYYLGALRAGEEMARFVGDAEAAAEYRRLFTRGRDWIDANLFNGEYYIQKVRGIPRDQIADGLPAGMGADDPEHPDFQAGDGCLVDQLVGQHVAEFAGLGPLLDPAHIRKTLESIYRYNYKRALFEHDTVQRVFALNDEAALVICDYGKGKRPEVPFPYFAEVMTGFEFSAAMLMLAYGMVNEGMECIGNIRRRYDGERRNAWDESECGRHYARAMAAWTAIPALSGFRYTGPDQRVTVRPRLRTAQLRSFWSAATAWGTFEYRTEKNQVVFELSVLHGRLPVRQVRLTGRRAPAETVAESRGRAVSHGVERTDGSTVLTFDQPAQLAEGDRLVVRI